MDSDIRLGRLFGIQIGLHYSWFLIAFLILLSLSQQFRIDHPGWSSGLVLVLALLTACLFFVSLLLHELSHSLVAKSAGIPVREITLFALGGVSNIEKNASSAKNEFLIAFVGPLTSAILGVICIGLNRLMSANTPEQAIFAWLGYINLGLALFNLIPGYPLDGGRILRAAIWWETGDADRATRIAARIGQATGILFIALGMFQFFGGAGFGGLWIAFIGWFLVQAAAASHLQVGLTHALEGVTVADAMTKDCPLVDGNMNLQTFVDEVLLRTGTPCFAVLRDSEVSGIVTPAEVKEIPRTKWHSTRLVDVMRPLNEIRTVEPQTPLKAALEIMGRRDLNQLPVMARGHLQGVISRSNVMSFLNTRMQFQS